MIFYTLTLTAQKKMNGLHLKVWQDFRSLLKTFIHQNNQNDLSEFKSLQYNTHSMKDNIYYIFVSTSPEFLRNVKKEMEKLIERAETNKNQKFDYCFEFGRIANSEPNTIK